MSKNKRRKIVSSNEVRESVCNNYDTRPNITNDKNPKENNKLHFDLSFEGLYYSVKHKDFNNLLKSPEQFVEKFRVCRKIITDITGKDFVREILKSRNRYHAHEIDGDERDLITGCIGKAMASANRGTVSDNLSQSVIEEKLYQIGLNGGVRFIGTYSEHTGEFRVFLIDYHHGIYFDQRKNKHGKKELKYCPMNALEN